MDYRAQESESIKDSVTSNFDFSEEEEEEEEGVIDFNQCGEWKEKSPKWWSQSKFFKW